ncbi:hypothetical protein ACFX2B_041066 [Malus domestica]
MGCDIGLVNFDDLSVNGSKGLPQNSCSTSSSLQSPRPTMYYNPSPWILFVYSLNSEVEGDGREGRDGEDECSSSVVA